MAHQSALRTSPTCCPHPLPPTVGFARWFRAHASTPASPVLRILWASCLGCLAQFCPRLGVCSAGFVLESELSVDEALDREVCKRGTCSLRKTRKYRFNQDERSRSVPRGPPRGLVRLLVFGLGHDLRAVGSSPTSGTLLIRLETLFPFAFPPCFHEFSLK